MSIKLKQCQKKQNQIPSAHILGQKKHFVLSVKGELFLATVTLVLALGGLPWVSPGGMLGLFFYQASRGFFLSVKGEFFLATVALVLALGYK